jgi:hypothetical protein
MIKALSKVPAAKGSSLFLTHGKIKNLILSAGRKIGQRPGLRFRPLVDFPQKDRLFPCHRDAGAGNSKPGGPGNHELGIHDSYSRVPESPRVMKDLDNLLKSSIIFNKWGGRSFSPNAGERGNDEPEPGSIRDFRGKN